MSNWRSKALNSIQWGDAMNWKFMFYICIIAKKLANLTLKNGLICNWNIIGNT